MTQYQHIVVPDQGEKICFSTEGRMQVPDCPIIPFIEGDGIGVDITPVMKSVVDAVVERSYGGKRRISWMEVYAGEKSVKLYGDAVWLPEETLQVLSDYVVSIKGPLTTPVGGGIRSINVALRQQLDLYVCLRPVRWFSGVPSPLREPHKTDMVIFRENSEDIYAGIEWPADSAEARRVIDFLRQEMKVKAIRFPETSGIGIKPVSREGTERLVRRAVQYALDDGQSQTGPPGVARSSPIDSVEAFGESWDMFGFYADSGILDRKYPTLRLAFPTDGDMAPGRGVADGIGDQIGKSTYQFGFGSQQVPFPGSLLGDVMVVLTELVGGLQDLRRQIREWNRD